MDSRIITRLRALRGRLRRLIALDGATWIVGTFLAVLLPTVGLDWWLHLPGPARLVLLAGALGGTAYAAWRFFIAPLRIPLADDDMALAVEQRYPELGDRLITSVQLAHTPQDRGTAMGIETAISRELVAAIDRETENLVRPLRFDAVFQLEGAGGRLALAGGLLALFVLLSLFAPGFVGTGLSRFFQPFGDARWPHRTQYEFVDRRERIAQGEDFRVKILVDPKSRRIPADAFIQFRAGRRDAWIIEPMINTSDGQEITFEALFSAVSENLQYRVLAGDNASPVYRVEVVEPPALESESIDLAYTYPKYMNRENHTESRGHGHVDVIRGTRVRLSARANKPLAEAWAVFPGRRERLKLDEDGRAFTFALPTETGKSTHYKIKLLDQEGFRNRSAEDYRINIKPDRPPKLEVEAPARSLLEITPAGRLRIAAQAEDDIAVQDMRVRYHVFRGKEKSGPKNRSMHARLQHEDDPRRLRADQPWDLAGLGLKPGQKLIFVIEARDRRPPALGGPGVGRSGEYTVQILSESEMAVRFDRRKYELRQRLQEIVKLQAGTKSRVDDLRQQIANLADERFNMADRRQVRRAERDQRTVIGRSRRLAARAQKLKREMADNRLLRRDDEENLQTLADALTAEAATNMPHAAKRLLNAATTKDAPTRGRSLTAAGDLQARILENLRSLLGRLNRWEQTEQLLRLARQLLNRQQKITAQTRQTVVTGQVPRGVRFASLLKKAQNLLRDLRGHQRNAGGEMKHLQDKMIDGHLRMKRIDKLVADKIAQALRVTRNIDADLTMGMGTESDGADGEARRQDAGLDWAIGLDDVPPSIEEQMRAAAANVLRNRLGAARTHQLKAQSGLERVIEILSQRGDVDYERLAREIARLRKQLRGLIGRERRNQQETRDLARQPNASKAEAQKLARKQDAIRAETDRLTRDINRAMQKMPSKSGLRARAKTQSASRAMRGAAGKQAGGSPGAADSDQEQAVQDLTQAEKELETMQREAQAKRQEEAEFQLSQALKEMLAIETDVKARTLDLDKRRAATDTARKDNRELTRLQRKRLKEIAATQGALAVRAAAVARSLKPLPVYEYGLRMLRNDLLDSRSLLDLHVTDREVQDIQQQIIDELKDMIEALKQQRRERKQSGGGQGGGGGSPVPSDLLPQVRLLRKMQLRVNEATMRLDRERGKAAPLSERQKERLARMARREGIIEMLTRRLAEDVRRIEKQMGQ